MSNLSEELARESLDAVDVTMDAAEKSVVEIPGDRTADDDDDDEEEDGRDSQDLGGEEDTGCSTDQEVEDEDPSREQTSSEVEVDEKDEANRTDASLLVVVDPRLPESEKRRSFDSDHSLHSADGGGGGNDGGSTTTTETANRSTAETNSHVFSSGGSRTDGRRNPLPPRENPANRGGGGRGGRAATEARAAAAAAVATAQDLSKFNSQYICADLKRTVEAIHAQQKQFTLPEKITTITEQLMRQMNRQGWFDGC